MKTKESSIRELRRLVQESCRNNPHLTSRLEKAAFLVLLRPIEALGDHHYQVRSEDGLRNYEVRNGHCECHDYVRHGPGHPCNHRQPVNASAGHRGAKMGRSVNNRGTSGPGLMSVKTESLRSVYIGPILGKAGGRIAPNVAGAVT